MLGDRRGCNRAFAARLQFCALCLGLLLGLLLPRTSQAFPAAARPTRPQLVWLQFKSWSELEEWGRAGLDVWDVEGNLALVQVLPQQLVDLKRTSSATAAVAAPSSLSFPECYRTYADLVAFFADRSSRYPDLVDVFDRGDTWEKQYAGVDHDIWAARLTSPRGPEEKPKLLVIAEQHAREIITPEVAMDFIDDLLSGYGSDATATWLLDEREVWIVPMANPDGHAHAARVEDWRKSASWPETCPHGVPPWSYGVDLNRNFDLAWDPPVGSSTQPCFPNYRGEAPSSEPETQAMRDLMLTERFDFMISLHSYGDEIMFPWAHTADPAPDAEELAALAGRMAAAAGYEAKQAAAGYPASGDTADWSYGQFGVPSFTLEIGSLGDGMFWPPCDVQPVLYDEARRVLIYAALAADDPYGVAGGPEAMEIEVDLEYSSARVAARVSDVWTGGQAIAGADVFLETPGTPGAGIPLVAVDGCLDGATEWMQAHLDEETLMRYAGQQVPLLVVAEDTSGQRGVPAVVWLDLRSWSVPAGRTVQVWLDGSPEPTYELHGGYVYGATVKGGPVLMTVADGRVYRGAGTHGELLFTLGPDWVRVADDGPIAYSLHDGWLYQGGYPDGNPTYRIDYNRLVATDIAPDAVVAQANVNLNADTMRTACLLLPVLLEERY